MIDLDVKADIKDVTRYLSDTQKRVIPKATSMALNKTIAKVNTRAKRKVAKSMGITQKRIKGSFSVTKASRVNLSAHVHASGKPIKLIYFTSTRQNKTGAASNAYGSRKTYKGTFIQTMPKTGHKGVYKRAGQERFPLKELYGPSVPKTFIEKTVENEMKSTASGSFKAEFVRATNHLLRSK